MKSQRLLAEKGKIIYFFFILLLCLRSAQSFSQPCTTIVINNSCTSPTTVNSGDCPTFTNTCNSTSGWTSSMGTPEIVYVPPVGETAGYYYAELVSLIDYDGEGMFYPFNFIQGQKYTVTVNGFSQGGLQLNAANGLVQSFSTTAGQCQGLVQPGDNYQSIGLTPETFSVTTSPPMSFTANKNYSQLWLVADMGQQDQTQVLSIQICPNCSLVAPSNLGTTNNTTTLTWQGVANASSYIINISDNHSGTITNSTLTSNTTSISYCPSSGDLVSYTVTSVCANGGYGATSESYMYTYTPPSLPAPTGLTFNKNYPYTVSWNAVQGAGSYLYEITHSSPLTVYGTSITDPEAELSNGQTYQVSVSAMDGCAINPSATIQVVMPAACSAPSFSNVEGGTYINLYPVSGAASYNIAYENSSGVIVYQVNNIGPVITTSGYQVTGVPAGEYYILAQTNCTGGSTGPWSSPYENSLQYASSIIKPLDSMTSQLSIPGTTVDSTVVLSIYPNPSRSQVNIVYNTPESGSADITVTTEFGNMVMHKFISAVSGQNNYMLNIGQLANGVYIVRLTDGKNIRYQKLVIVK